MKTRLFAWTLAALSCVPALAFDHNVDLEARLDMLQQQEKAKMGGQPAAQPVIESQGSNCCGGGCCGGGCGGETLDSWCWYVDAEATLLRYHRANGVRIGNDLPADNVEFGFEVSPRITVGALLDDGLGVRVRWWDYNFTNPSFGGTGNMTVDAMTLDVEAFESFDVTCNTTVELSGGIRFNDFSEIMNDQQAGAVRSHDFDSYGGVIGLRANRKLCIGGNLYANARGAILMSDQTRINANSGTETFLDVTRGMTEIGMGYEWGTCWCNTMVTFRTGVEWQNWYGYSSSFDTIDEGTWQGASDVGFGGYVLGVTLQR